MTRRPAPPPRAALAASAPPATLAQMPIVMLVLMLAAMLTTGAPALGQTIVPDPAPSVPDPASSVAVLGGEDAGSPASGRIAVNVAAGAGHQQANIAAIAIGDAAVADITLSQRRGPSAHAAMGPARAVIAGDALAGAGGLIAVNVTAGTDNQLANLAGIAIGATAATSLQLAQASAPTTPTTNDPQPRSPGAAAELSADAFQGATGLVQVNLVGGDRNAASNSFALAIAGQGTP